MSNSNFESHPFIFAPEALKPARFCTLFSLAGLQPGWFDFGPQRGTRRNLRTFQEGLELDDVAGYNNAMHACKQARQRGARVRGAELRPPAFKVHGQRRETLSLWQELAMEAGDSFLVRFVRDGNLLGPSLRKTWTHTGVNHTWFAKMSVAHLADFDYAHPRRASKKAGAHFLLQMRRPSQRRANT